MVVGSLDAFFEIGGPNDIVMTRNQTTPLERLGQTSLFRFPVGKLVPLQEKFPRRPATGGGTNMNSSNASVTRNASRRCEILPAAFRSTFPPGLSGPFPLNYFLPPQLPADATRGYFSAWSAPQHAIDGQFGYKGRVATPIDHIRGLFSPDRREKSPFRYLRHYILPSPWVAEHWRE